MKLLGAIGLAVFALLAGCSSDGPSAQAGDPATAGEAEKLLRWSMDQHKALKTYQAKVGWSLSAKTDSMNAERTFLYEAPNKFFLTSELPNGEFFTIASNGKQLLEFGETADVPGTKTDAPVSLAYAESQLLGHPAFGGSLLYQFFDGSANYDGLVDTSEPVTLGRTETLPNGNEGQVVKFTSADVYGNAEVLIDKKTGLVQRITYDLDGLAEKGTKGSETLSEVKVDQALDAAKFSPQPPKGITLSDGPTSNAPVKKGDVAPDFTVADLSGKEVKLSSLRGKPVLIDFWATWCGPCLEGLPDTQKKHNDFKDRLHVVAVSDEEVATVSSFLKENNYTFPAYISKGGAAHRAYNVTGVPTIVVLDKDGKLVDYFEGLPPERAIKRALKRAGL